LRRGTAWRARASLFVRGAAGLWVPPLGGVEPANTTLRVLRAKQEQKPVHARQMETDQQAPAPRAATGTSVEFQHSGQARDLPPIQGLTLRYCTVQQTTEDEDQWTLKLSAAHGRNEEDGTPKVDWRMTYGSYDARKKALDECDKWLSRIDQAIKQELTERSKPEEKKQPAHDQH